MECPAEDVVVFTDSKEFIRWLKGHGACKHILQFYKNLRGHYGPAGMAYFHNALGSLCYCSKPNIRGFFYVPDRSPQDVMETITHELAHCISMAGHTKTQRSLSADLMEHMKSCAPCQKRFGFE